MKVITEKREIVGVLKTLVGNYHLLDEHFRLFNGLYRFRVVDDENFENWIQFIGDFIIIPVQIPAWIDVKRVITKEEAKSLSEEQLVTELTIES
jgi:hypothetical protein